MVWKPNIKRRMCTDYTDLNKAYRKDPYLLLSIDPHLGTTFQASWMPTLVTTRFAWPSSQIAVVMPFGLKNVGPTYQRLMDKNFRDQIDHDLEVYVDDMVVKSTLDEQHYEVLDRVFRVFRKHQLKLNLEKCSFGVQAGKFLSFMLTRREIEANPKKCKVLISLEVHREGVADFLLPLKNEKIPWMSKCESTFQELKAILASPPVHTKKVCLFSFTYLFLMNQSVSPWFKKLTRASYQFIWSVRSYKVQKPGIRSYKSSISFSDHYPKATTVFPKSPDNRSIELQIKQVLRKPDQVGRMVKWIIELLEFNTSYERRVYVKTQVLADFITELALTEEGNESKREWMLSVNGASNQEGNEVGVVLEGPNSIERVNLLSKLASTQKSGFNRLFIQEMLHWPTIEEVEVCCTSPNTSWMTPIINYLHNDVAPINQLEAKKHKREASKYTLIARRLCRRGFSYSLLRFLDPDEAKYAKADVHEGICRMHIGRCSLASKIMIVNYY
ncbi:hypothetical protein CR513_31899, partial [Mucuna pruriens]